MRVLFLYTELADYVIKCCEVLANKAEVHIVRWPVNVEAPFQFNFSNQLKVYNRRDYNAGQLLLLAKTISPDIIICSGWIDKDYLRVVKEFSGKIATVMTLDTQWRGDFKQQIARLISRFYLLPRFSHAWVPGESQACYANKLGFKRESIQLGFYSCDLDNFNALYNAENLADRIKKKRFFYVGRYYDFKGISDLWSAFISFYNSGNTDWELWCMGTGDIEPIQHPNIKHFGFVQPKNLADIVNQCSVFVLPSRYEPWAVVVHEFAAAGYPLILSNKVGAAESFLEDGKNGFKFVANDSAELCKALIKMAGLSEKTLTSMSERSHQLAQRISPEKWANTIISMYNGFKRK